MRREQLENLEQVEAGSARVVGDDEPVRHVELDEVGAGVDRSPEGLTRVLGRLRTRTTVRDDQRPPVLAAEPHGERRKTTIAQSSARSPPAKPRHAKSTAFATSCAGLPEFCASTSSSRSTPKSSRPRRDSITPSV